MSQKTLYKIYEKLQQERVSLIWEIDKAMMQSLGTKAIELLQRQRKVKRLINKLYIRIHGL